MSAYSIKYLLVFISACTFWSFLSCDDSGTSPAESKITDNEIKGKWIKVSGYSPVDTAIFTEERLEAPWVSAFRGGYKVEGGQIILADKVMDEYVIENDTLFIESLLGEEPDGIVDRQSAIKYVPLFQI